MGPMLRTAFVVLCLLASVVSPASSEEKPIPILEHTVDDPTPRKASGTSASIATNGAIETVVYCEDFENGAAGWTALDVDASRRPTDVFWHLDAGDWFCATEDPCFVNPGPGYGNNWDQRLSKSYTLVTAVDAIGNLIGSVRSLLGEDKGLIRKLEEAITLIKKGKTLPATNKLKDFTDQVGARVNSGALTQAQGDALTGAALSIIVLIENGPSVQLRHAYNTEFFFDRCFVEVLPQGSSEFVVLASFDGDSRDRVGADPNGIVTELIDLSLYAGTTVTLRFRFTSDRSGSDEDGLYPTNGAWRIDRLTVSVYPVEDFTTEQGWTPSVNLSPALANFRLESEPLCNPPAQYLIDNHGITTLNCDHPSRCESPTAGNTAWVAYDPATGLIPNVPLNYYRLFIPGIESPIIPIPPSVGTSEYRLVFDVFADQQFRRFLPPAEQGIWSGVVRQFDFAFPAAGDACPPRFVRSNFWNTDAAVGWRADSRVFTPTSDQVIIRLALADWNNLTAQSAGTNRGRGPYYDNIRIIHITAPPGPPLLECLPQVFISGATCPVRAPTFSLNSPFGIIRVLDDTTPRNALILNQNPSPRTPMASGDFVTLTVTDQDGLTSEPCQIQIVAVPDPCIAKADVDTPVEVQVPTAYELGQNVPNPFNPQTTIRLSLPVASAYTLSIYDITGRLVRTYAGDAGAGSFSITWEGTDNSGVRVGSGLYFYKVQAGAFTETKRMVLLK